MEDTEMKHSLRHNVRAAWHVLRKFDGLDYEQAAEFMGCSFSTVRKNILVLTKLGLAMHVENQGRRMAFIAICDGTEIEFASYDKNSTEKREKISAAKAAKKAQKQAVEEPPADPRITRHICGNQIHGDRGTGQRSGLRRYGFSSGERVA